MSTSEDIKNLFGKFEGQSQQYQEVTRDDQASDARSRWPLLSSVALDETDLVPDVADTQNMAGQPSVAELMQPTPVPHTVHGSRGATAASGTLRSALFGGRASNAVGAESDRATPSAAKSRSVSDRERTPNVSAAPAAIAPADAERRTERAEPASAPTSAFSPPRAPEPRPAALPFMREAAPAFRVHTGPVPTEPMRSDRISASPLREAPHSDSPAPPSVARREAAGPTISRVQTELPSYPPVVTPDTSKRHSPLAQDFAPPVVPVNQFKPSASPITGVEHESTAHAPLTHTSAIPSGSILGKLFAPATPAASEPEASTPHDTGSRDLSAVFGRLAGRGRGALGRSSGGEGA